MILKILTFKGSDDAGYIPVYIHHLVVHPSICVSAMWNIEHRSDLVADLIRVELLRERICIGELVTLNNTPCTTAL